MVKFAQNQSGKIEREQMVEQQIERRGVQDPRVLAAMRSVPRHLFLPEGAWDMAYADCPLPIGAGQTISQPYIVALMTELLHLEEADTVLEVGTGSGYQAAVLGCLAKTVHTVERIPELAQKAQRLLADLGYHHVVVHTSDGSLGWIEAAPYQAIIVTAAAPDVPQPLLEQLAEGGRLVIPVGQRYYQELQIWQRKGDCFSHEAHISVAFVPLRGAHGWKDESWI